jgi:signal transduction histidine kinase
LSDPPDTPGWRELERRLAAAAAEGVPLLVIRVPALERTAWRAGLRAARTLERRTAAAFAEAAARVLRAGDLTAHARGSDAFVAALAAPMRDGRRAPAPIDVRSALARIAAGVSGRVRLEVETGWTRYDGRGAGGIEPAIERALLHGAQERERYAFFSAVGHELRTPLASIRGYLETLLTGDVDPANRRRFLQVAHGETLRLSRLLDGMFEISLLDLSVPFPARGAGRLDVALRAALEACAGRAEERGVTVRVAPAEPVTVAIDGDRLALVFINVIDNAIKHGRSGGRVEVAADVAERAIAVTIDDDGPGIPAAERERVFALGQRGATGANGTGIGLALVRLLLERAGGRVEVRDSPLGGARFALAIARAALPERNVRPISGVMRK